MKHMWSIMFSDQATPSSVSRFRVVQGNHKWHQYQVVGRLLPTEKAPEPTVYRMKIWAQDAVRARSRFWCVPRLPNHFARALPCMPSSHPLVDP